MADLSEADGAWGEPRTKTLSWYDPAIALASATALPGREFLQAILDRRRLRGAVPAPGRRRHILDRDQGQLPRAG